MTSADTKTRSAGPFAQGTLIALALISIVSFIGYVVLSAYSDELDPGQDGSTHALSRSAVGFAGIVRLMNATELANAGGVYTQSAHATRSCHRWFGI